MIRVSEATIGAISKGTGFLKRQQRDWLVTVARTSTDRFFYQMIFPYLSVYIVALGATGTELGIVNSVGLCAAAFISPFIGWLIDTIGAKRIYLIGIGFLILSYFTYSVAQFWTIIFIAMGTYHIGNGISIHSCAVTCGNSLANEDRATGMNFCESVTAGLLGFAGPMLGAFIVQLSGGVNVSGIRPLFFIALAGTIGTFLLILTKLSDRRWVCQDESRFGLFEGIAEVFKRGHNLKRMLAINSLTWLPYGMVLPFTQVFAHEIKGADDYTLGAMVSGFALTSLLFGVPLGRLADKIGRKKVLLLLAPFSWASNLMLIFAPGPEFLIVAGILQGVFWISVTTMGAMTFEIVLPEQLGVWTGCTRFFWMLLAAGAAYLAGAIWDNIGPQYLFLTAIGIDALIRLPLLIGMPDTLGLRREMEQK
ncbi:MAG: MFS transporter [Desulfobacteraceae bacterium]|nr:MFS transporter [Desulfobacteraceae bacterium]